VAKPYSIMKISSFFVLFFVCLSIALQAQIPNDLSKLKADQITDAQLQDFIKRAGASGLTESQIEAEFQRRGMPISEIEVLKSRIKTLQPAQSTATGGEGVISNNTRKVDQEANTSGPTVSVNVSENSIFGSELFSNSNLTFAPNLKIPTPKNYIVGTDDELLLDISGINISQQALRVSTEGNVNVRYAGPIQVSGLTIEEAKSKIVGRLTKFYPAISNGGTKVQVTLGNIRTNSITIIGAVQKPGTYQISSLATLFNALYVSGGPTENGSFRNIQLVRNNRTVIVADLYDFLMNTDKRSDVRLEDGDVIKIPFIETRVQIKGRVNRPGLYELKKTELFNDLLKYSGGFLADAYKARIIGTRNTDFDKRILDISKEQFDNFKLQSGDILNVSPIVERIENKVSIQGAVYKAGDFALTKDLTLQQLIIKAEGLKEDAFTKRIIINRLKADFTKEIVSVGYDDATSFMLRKYDEVIVSSVFDIKERFTVTINGAIRKPSTFNFEDSLSLKSLILLAGGFADNATGKGITIARRKKDVQTNIPGSAIVDMITIDDEKDLSKKSADILLQPYDIVTVKVNPYYKQQISVNVSGEVLLPGAYTLTSREERISALLQKAGGVLYTGSIADARLRRKTILSEADTAVVNRIARSNSKDSSGGVLTEEIKPFYEVAIDLQSIMANPNSANDIVLLEGDELIIPLRNNMVGINGEVYKPLSIAFDEDKSFRDYLNNAGGVTLSGTKKRAYIIYANGRADRVRRYWFIKSYPKVEPGAKIYIPKVLPKSGNGIATAGLIITGIASLITATALAIQFTR
jgi:protein involved in polysaccharide export with SLBB domain